MKGKSDINSDTIFNRKFEAWQKCLKFELKKRGKRCQDVTIHTVI